jgi:lipid-A-disaccharide synthase
VLLESTRRIDRPVEVTVVKAPALDDATAVWLESNARDAGADVMDGPLALAEAPHHVALSASGTATLECAALGVPPVIVYRTGAVTYALARRLVTTPRVGLPNIVLERTEFPELVQRSVTPIAVADAACAVLDRPAHFVAACSEVRSRLDAPLGGATYAERVQAMLEPWLA